MKGKARLISSLATIILIAAIFLTGCKDKSDRDVRTGVVIDSEKIVFPDGHSGKLFDVLTRSTTGLDFFNDQPDNYIDNYWRYTFIYNGGSVNVLDINNDGLQDIFFSGVGVHHRLYLNEGGLHFRDITETSGIFKLDYEWASGATTADVNGDGWTDIYILNSRRNDPDERRNRLFINNKDNTFSEESATYGLDVSAYSSAAEFFDYDNDGDLDLYLVTHPVDFINRFKIYYFQLIEKGENYSDLLFRNDGGGKFTEVHKESGIDNHGFGLSVCTADLDEDGWLDIYVANDFGMYDYIYLNNGNGTFKDVSLTAVNHHNVSSMGTDIADIDNDGYQDIYSADIEMSDNYTYKTFQVSTQIEVVRALTHSGYGYQKHGNSLKWNLGNGHFAEIGRASGVAETDWGWSPFFADFDNDGFKDLFVSTGYLQDFNIDETELYHSLRRACRISDSSVYNDLIRSIPRNVLNHSNYFFKNLDGLGFQDMREEWGVYYPSVSNGAAYADFDNDGDLDVVASNGDDYPVFYRNNASSLLSNNFLRIKLEGDDYNTSGFGAKVKVYLQGASQYIQHSTNRGFISNMEDFVHFGIGSHNKVDSIEITWPNGKRQVLVDVPANQTIKIRQENAVQFKESSNAPGLNMIENKALVHRHSENDYDDFRREFILPHKMSEWGPCMAIGDANGDGKDDLYIGGSLGFPGTLYVQGNRGFEPVDFDFSENGKYEDGAALFIDVEDDGDLDLIIASGGNEYPMGDQRYNTRLFINQGKGQFNRKEELLPLTDAPVACLKANDFDNDGDLDLFVGGRQIPGQYGRSANSYIWENTGNGFINATDKIAPELNEIGIVTSAIWTDVDGDENRELVVVGEWMSPCFFDITDGHFIKSELNTPGIQLEGWWQTITAADIDNDGDQDFLLGNFGTNRRYLNELSSKGVNLPIELYVHDFDHSGSMDAVMAYYQNDKMYPITFKERLLEQIPGIGNRIPDWDTYGKMTMFDLFGDDLEIALHKSAFEFRSVVLMNEGDGQFLVHPLPFEAQISLIIGAIPLYYNTDNYIDFIVQGNYFETDILHKRHDASPGFVLLGNGDGTFGTLRPNESGFFNFGDTRGLGWLSINGELVLISLVNDGELKCYSFRDKLTHTVVPDGLDEVIIELEDGHRVKWELPLESTGNVQNGRIISIPPKSRVVF